MGAFYEAVLPLVSITFLDKPELKLYNFSHCTDKNSPVFSVQLKRAPEKLLYFREPDWASSCYRR